LINHLRRHLGKVVTFLFSTNKINRSVRVMPRSARIVIPGLPHHVTQRGNRRQKVFFCDEDYRSYLKFMVNSLEAFGVALLSYCLMPNHVHLLLIPPSENSLREAVGTAHQIYTRFINNRQSWQGHLWQGRFFSCAVEPSGAPFVARYIELNPVRARMVCDPRSYPWSSASQACQGGSDGRSGFADIFAPSHSWSAFLQEGIENQSYDFGKKLQTSTRTGRPLGSSQFIRQMELQTGLVLEKKTPGRKLNSQPAL
jgi:putative transposase